MKAYQYVIILHPTKGEAEKAVKSKLLVEVTTFRASGGKEI